MATRLATQRSFITVTPVTPATTGPTAVVGTSSVSPAQAATTGPHQNDAMTVSTSPSKTATITIPASAIQGSSTLKNGTGKSVTIAAATTTANQTATAPIIPTSLIANNLSIANILGAQNGGLTLQQIIQQVCSLLLVVRFHLALILNSFVEKNRYPSKWNSHRYSAHRRGRFSRR